MLKQSRIGALTGAVLFASAAVTTSVRAEAAEPAAPAYRMAAVVDRAHGRALVAGDYPGVIKHLREKRAYFEASTNLCVAYAMSGDLARADTQCAKALELSETAAVRRDTALALTNVGVIAAARGDLAAARSSFSRALELNKALEPASANLQRLSAESRS